MKIILIAFLTSILVLFGGCSVKNEPEPIVVSLFRDPDAAELEKAILAVGLRQLRTSHGRPIVIATYEPKSYADDLTMLGHRYHPQLIIFNSLEDGEKAKVEVPPQSILEVSRKRCYLVIPAWVTGEDREAAQLVMVGFRQEMSRTASKP